MKWLVVLLSLLPCVAMASEALTVGASSSLVHVLRRLAPEAEAAGFPLRTSLAATGVLAAQVRAGAPFRILLAADPLIPQRLMEDGYLVQGTRRLFAHGRLVVGADAQVAIPDGPDAWRLVVGDAALGRIAIANPAHAPYGIAAEAVLVAAGVLPAQAQRLVRGESVAQVAQYLFTGQVRVAVVAAALLEGADPPFQGRVLPIPEHVYRPVDHVVAVVAGGTPEDIAKGRTFVAWLCAPERADHFRRCGLDPIGDQP